MGKQLKWTEDQQQLLVKLWQDDVHADQIGKALGINGTTVRTYVKRNRERLGLTPRKNHWEKGIPRSQYATGFDRQWHGVIPCGHWMITKKWGRS
jgi:hypothetical protein